LLTQAGDAAAGVPPFGLPTNRPTDDPYKLRWYGKVVEGAVKPPADRYLLDLPGLGKQPVAFDPGDRLLVRIQRTAEGARFNRGVYFRDYEIKPDRAEATVKRQAENGDWLLAVPGNQIQLDAARQDLSLVVGLESLQGLTPGETGLLKQVRPEFVWWEISQNTSPKPARDVTGTRPGYGRADNLSGYPTPAWHLTVKDWPRAAGYAEPRLRAWPMLSLSGLNPDPVVAKRLTLAVPTAGEVAGTIPDRGGGTYSVRVAHEEAKVRSTTRKEPDVAAMKCAVVRIDHPPGREVFARMAITRKDGSTVPVTVDEHRYFRQANAVTAYVGPLDDREVEAGVQIVIELVSIPDLKTAVKNQFVLDALGPPRRDYDLRLEQPQPQRDVEFSPGR
jgi:hypothetical protein